MSVCRDVFSDFLREVVKPFVFSSAERERGSGPLGDKQTADIGAGRRIDDRVPVLAQRSGKGGWSPDPARAATYAKKINVSLLDHLASVVRGALQFAALDLAAGGVSEPDLRRRLRVVAAVGFLHDADKILDVKRSGEVTEEQMLSLIERYGIDAFLAGESVSIGAAQMLCLLDEAEVSRAGRIRPGAVRPSREMLHDCNYVRLADRVDGASLNFALDDKGRSGIEVALDEMARFDGLDTDALRLRWHKLEIRDPHIPTLIDAFQQGLSDACVELCGHPPLVEVHHDGSFVAIVPEARVGELVAAGIAGVLRPLGAAIRIVTNARGSLDVVDAAGTFRDLRDAVDAIPLREREGLLRGGIMALREKRDAMDALLSPYDLMPTTPDLVAYPGKLVPLWAGIDRLGDGFIAVHKDAVAIAAVLRSPKAEASVKRGKAPFGPARREAELLAVLSSHEVLAEAPDWFASVDDATRRNLIAAVAAGASARDRTLETKVVAVCDRWLAGTSPVDEVPGFAGINDFVESSAGKFAPAVKAHFEALLGGRPASADETAEGRCHFTNAPVPKSSRIDGKSGLYGLKVSAFSGREGRPESFSSAESETLVSAVAEAENRLRQIEFARSGKSSTKRKLPVRITSPVTAGLFPALVFDKGAPQDFAMSDILRVKIGPEKLVFHDETGLDRRKRIARYEEFPSRLASTDTEPGQLAFVAMVIRTAMRTGRPVHVFRGLPVPRPEFVAFDALPPAVELVLGGTGLRLEQLPSALSMLRGVEAIAKATGFGAELALRFADPATRFAAACDVLERLAERQAADDAKPEVNTAGQVAGRALDEKEIIMSATDSALVDFGEAMAKVQRSRNAGDGGGFSEQGLKTALEVVDSLYAMGQTSDASLEAGVAGSLMELMQRRLHFARSAVRDGLSVGEALEQAIAVFITRVWRGAFAGAPPSSRDRRTAVATYRFAFDRASRRRSAAAKAAEAGSKLIQTDDDAEAAPENGVSL